MKKLLKILLLIIIPFTFLISTNPTFATTNLETWWQVWGVDKNSRLESFFASKFMSFWSYSDKWLTEVLVLIAKDIKNAFYVLATIYFLVIVIKLILSQNTEEELGKFKKWVIWITVWIMVMQISFSFVTILFDKDIWWWLAENLSAKLINPLIVLLETVASIFFLATALIAFYKIVTANGNDDAVKTWKMSILYAIMWYIVIKFARVLAEATYGWVDCTWTTSSCIWQADLSKATWIIVTIINWANSFLAIVVIIMIVYAWFNILLSWWDDDKVKKWKSSIIYIAIGLLILALNYIILTFFL